MYLICLRNKYNNTYKHTVHNIAEVFAYACIKILKLEYQCTEEYTNEYEVTTLLINKIKNINLRFLLFNGSINNTGIYLQNNISKLNYLQQEELIAVYDDITIKTGSVSITFGRGSGHHNGPKSIDYYFNKKYWRLRIGFLKPLFISSNNFVLSNLSEENINIIENLSKKIILKLVDFIINFDEVTSIRYLQEYVNSTCKI